MYAVKFSNNKHGDGRGLVSEHVAGRCGALLGAPVAAVELIDVGEHLVAGGLVLLTDGTPVISGVHHGSAWRDGYGDRKEIEYVDENQVGFAALQVLYTWLLCTGDHQLLYRDIPPHHVLSVDHTEMLPGSTGDWTPEVLSAQASTVVPDGFFGPAALDPSSFAESLSRLEAVSESEIAEVVAGPPDAWGLDLSDRIALAAYLWTRREKVLEVLP